MKKVIIFTIIIVIVLFNNVLLKENNNINAFDSSMQNKYSEYHNVDINKLPNDMFYKLNVGNMYIMTNSTTLIIKNLEDSEKFFYIIINNHVNKLGDEDYNPRKDASVYIIKNSDKFYLLVDKMHENDARFCNLYSIVNDKIELVETCSGRIDFVGYDYIIGYTDLGIIGYQRSEFKKVFKNGKLELEGEYKVVGNEYYPASLYYTLTKDLKYSEYDNNKKKYNEVVLKKGTKVRAVATDKKNYIVLETEEDKKGIVKIDKIDEEYDGNFIVNGETFMSYYFLDGTKQDYEVFSSMPVY